jgi:uncharacterized protein YqjF (DUF2071 family)
VSITPFLVRNLHPPMLPAMPWISHFPETNVRTYVVGPEGHRGIWFFSLDADRLMAVMGARVSYGLPYYWSAMQVEQAGRVMHYTSQRHGNPKAQTRINVELLDSVSEGNQDVLDHFLTARFRLYTMRAGRLVYTQVEHPPWPLQRGRAIKSEESLIEAAGLPAPEGEVMVHYSEGVEVAVGPPKRVSD